MLAWIVTGWLSVDDGLVVPTHKLYGALSEDKAAAFTAELTELIRKFNRAEDGTMVVPSKYLELVITRAG